MNIRQNLFGQGPKAGREQAGYGRLSDAPSSRGDTPMGGYEDPRGGYSDRGSYNGPVSSRPAMPSRPAVGRNQGRKVQMRIAKVEDKTKANQYIFGNM
jgi:vesicle-fusing ATPase